MAPSNSPPPYPVRVAVMGGGNFGLALASVSARNGFPTTILMRSKEDADCINRTRKHPRFMADLTLPDKIRATTDPAQCLPDATYIIHAVPVQYSRKFLDSVRDYIPPGTPVISGSKGIETSSLGFMADILRECLGNERSYAFLSGPSFAREICEGVATAVVVASEDLLLARDVAELFSDNAFRIFTSKDVMGVEIGGAVKNVIALAAGMCEGLGLGTNAMSALVTRGCGEMRRLGVTFGARPSTISGLSGTFWSREGAVCFLVVSCQSCANVVSMRKSKSTLTYLLYRILCCWVNGSAKTGVGDTFGTCFGPLSRNRKFGYRLGRGETMEEILASSVEVAEGVDTSIALVNLIKQKCRGYRMDLKYPILFGIAAILKGDLTPREGLKGIMEMPFLMESFDER
jgi:glycerol-3-phosphate dehydrogenase (NAD+)